MPPTGPLTDFCCFFQVQKEKKTRCCREPPLAQSIHPQHNRVSNWLVGAPWHLHFRNTIGGSEFISGDPRKPGCYCHTCTCFSVLVVRTVDSARPAWRRLQKEDHAGGWRMATVRSPLHCSATPMIHGRRPGRAPCPGPSTRTQIRPRSAQADWETVAGGSLRPIGSSFVPAASERGGTRNNTTANPGALRQGSHSRAIRQLQVRQMPREKKNIGRKFNGKGEWRRMRRTSTPSKKPRGSASAATAGSVSECEAAPLRPSRGANSNSN